MKGDEEGELTHYVPKGYSVIDYVIANEEARKGICRFKVEKIIKSVYQSVVVEVRKEGEEI